MGIFAKGQIGFSAFGVISIVGIVSLSSTFAATKARAWSSGASAYQQQAEGYCRAGNLAAARSAYENWAKAAPSDFRPWFENAHCFYTHDDTPEAIREINKGVRALPSSDKLWAMRASDYFLYAKQTDINEGLWVGGGFADPQHPELKQAWEEAANAESALLAHPGDQTAQDVYLVMATELGFANDIDQSVQYYYRTIRLNPATQQAGAARQDLLNLVSRIDARCVQHHYSSSEAYDGRKTIVIPHDNPIWVCTPGQEQIVDHMTAVGRGAAP